MSVLGKTGIKNQQTRDEFGNEPDLQTIYKLKDDNIVIEESPLIVNQITIGNTFVLNSLSNGIMGLWSDTQNSEDLFLNENGKVSTTDQVIPHNNRYVELFNYA